MGNERGTTTQPGTLPSGGAAASTADAAAPVGAATPFVERAPMSVTGARGTARTARAPRRRRLRDVAVEDDRRDAVLPFAPSRARRAGYVAGPAVYAWFAVIEIVGAVTVAAFEEPWARVSSLLYVVAAVTSVAVAVTMIVAQVQGGRGRTASKAAVRAVYLVGPVAGAFVLAAAYVSRLNGGPFIGGFEAMFGTTLALMLLWRRVSQVGPGPR